MSKHGRSRPTHISAPPSQREPSSIPSRRDWKATGQQLWLVLMYAATLQLTWPLWGERVTPPLLPLVELPAFAYYGLVLLATAACIPFWPRVSLAVNVLVGLTAMTADQTRMQPELFSFWLLTLGTLPHPVCKFICRSYLASLWFFSGFHKLISPAYYTSVAPFLWDGILPAEQFPSFAYLAVPTATLTAVVEISLGVAVWFPRLRRVAAVLIVMLHSTAVLVLYRLDTWRSPISAINGWNTAVYPWNLALAVVGASLIYSWRSTPAEERRTCGTLGFTTGLVFFVSPLLFYVGLLDAYLSHCLYSANVASAVMIPADSRSQPYPINGISGPYWSNVNVPQPPAHRIFAEYFHRTAQPGDRLEVEDPRLWAIWTGWDRYRWQHTGVTFERIRLSSAERSP